MEGVGGIALLGFIPQSNILRLDAIGLEPRCQSSIIDGLAVDVLPGAFVAAAKPVHQGFSPELVFITERIPNVLEKLNALSLSFVC